MGLHNPSALVLEQLDFRYGGLSRRLNRILSRAGRAAVKRKLESLQETPGIANYLVNPAHTSRECLGCEFTHKRNRKGTRFHCLHCSKKSDANVNGARIVLKRFRHDQAWLYIGKAQVLSRLDQAFRARWNVDPAQIANAYQKSKSTPKCRRASGARSGSKPVQMQTVA